MTAEDSVGENQSPSLLLATSCQLHYHKHSI
uniref:Uncharacterized protein n=1 Tax=Anguilla anguilla TaxID=7936 RepID=A0A0E9UJI9_ANGAN